MADTLQRARAVVATGLGLDVERPDGPTALARLQEAAKELREPSLDALLDRLDRRPPDDPLWGQVARHLTIGETSFYRDARWIRNLEQAVVRPLLDTPATTPLSVWSAGCASGEEAYTLAMLLLANCGAETPRPLDVIGSDINPDFVAAAQRGLYRAQVLREVPAAWRRRFFEQIDDRRYRIRSDALACVRFAWHNLQADRVPPLKQGKGYDLIVCRNVLMYMTPAAQQRVVRRLIDALAPGGVIVTSPVEAFAALFAPIRPTLTDNLIYFRKTPPAVPAPNRPVSERPGPTSRAGEPRPPQPAAAPVPLPAAVPPPDEAPELDGALWLQVAARFEARGEWQQAEDALEKAAFLMRGSPLPHLRRAWLWQRLGEPCKARQAAGRARRLAEQASDTETLTDLERIAPHLGRD